jgi:hypothetical protein
MPHDKDGVELKPGDRVAMEFTVRDVFPGAETCNIALVRELPEEQSVHVTCQAKQVKKLD